MAIEIKLDFKSSPDFARLYPDFSRSKQTAFEFVNDKIRQSTPPPAMAKPLSVKEDGLRIAKTKKLWTSLALTITIAALFFSPVTAISVSVVVGLLLLGWIGCRLAHASHQFTKWEKTQALREFIRNPKSTPEQPSYKRRTLSVSCATTEPDSFSSQSESRSRASSIESSGSEPASPLDNNEQVL